MHFKVKQLLMLKYWRRGVQMGRTTLETPVEKYFGFSVFDIDQVHHQKAGEGQGNWFRLLDGRVIDWRGLPCDPDPSLYDATMN